MYLCGQSNNLKLRACCSPSGPPPSSLLTGLVSYWKLDESSNGSTPVTRVDSVVASGNDLTDNNTVASTAGLIGNAGQFVAGNTEYLSKASWVQVGTAGTGATLALWFNATSNVGSGSFPSMYAYDSVSGIPPLGLLWGDTAGSSLTGRIVTSDNAVRDATLSSAGGLVNGAWHLAVLWWDTSDKKARLQIDNGAIQVSTAGADVNVNAGAGTALRIGVWPYGNFSGLLDEIGLWNLTLTSNQRTSLYNGGAGVTYPFTGVA